MQQVKESPPTQFRYLNKSLNRILNKAKTASFPGFEGIPIYDVIVFFFRGIIKGSLSTRASSIAFHFILALPPAIIFLFTLIPFLPVDNFQSGLLSFMVSVLPENVYMYFEKFLADMFIKRKALHILGFLTALFFATNGINGMIVAFNATFHSIETRKWWERRLIAAILVIILFTLITTAVSLIIFSRLVVRKLVELEIFRKDLTYYLLLTGKWIIIVAFIFFAVSFLYYLAPSRKMKWKFYSTGSTFACLLIIFTSLGFSAFINNFGRFNEFFGSLGTLMVILLWLYLNAIALLIGFELNTSIKNAKLVFEDT